MNSIKDKKILITGAAGFIGSHLCSRLLDNGANVNARIEGLFDHPGKSPLDYSNENNHTEISELLRKHDGKTSDELDATGN